MQTKLFWLYLMNPYLGVNLRKRLHIDFFTPGLFCILSQGKHLTLPSVLFCTVCILKTSQLFLLVFNQRHGNLYQSQKKSPPGYLLRNIVCWLPA